MPVYFELRTLSFSLICGVDVDVGFDTDMAGCWGHQIGGDGGPDGTLTEVG